MLIAGSEDPLPHAIDEVVSIGYIEPYPVHPRHPPHVEVRYGLRGLVRSVDLTARRHRYAVEKVPDGRLAGELGSLFSEPTGECEPLWIDDDGRVSTTGWPQPDGRPLLRTAARWAAAPLTWRRCGPAVPRLRATARRTYDSARIFASEGVPATVRPGNPAGYLLRTPTNRTIALYAATHPVIGDQFLANSEREASMLGHKQIVRLGYLIADAPVTGRLGSLPVGVPWGSRFGRGVVGL